MAEIKVKGHCPRCGPDRMAHVLGQHHESGSDDDIGIWHEIDYRILQCGGCQTIFFQEELIFSEDEEVKENPRTGEYESYIPPKFTYWPKPEKRNQPDWSHKLRSVDDDLDSLFDDIYVALNNNLNILTAIGIRTLFDRASELLGVDPAISFRKKLDALLNQGKIGADEKMALDILTDAGSAAAHRGWRPKFDEIETMMNIIEGFIHRTFILGPAVSELGNRVPEKPIRRE